MYVSAYRLLTGFFSFIFLCLCLHVCVPVTQMRRSNAHYDLFNVTFNTNCFPECVMQLNNMLQNHKHSNVIVIHCHALSQCSDAAGCRQNASVMK